MQIAVQTGKCPNKKSMAMKRYIYRCMLKMHDLHNKIAFALCTLVSELKPAAEEK